MLFRSRLDLHLDVTGVQTCALPISYDKERSDTGVLAVLLHQSELKSYIKATRVSDEQDFTHAPMLH